MTTIFYFKDLKGGDLLNNLLRSNLIAHKNVDDIACDSDQNFASQYIIYIQNKTYFPKQRSRLHQVWHIKESLWSGNMK